MVNRQSISRRRGLSRVVAAVLMLGLLSDFAPAGAALPDPTFTVPISPIAVNEQTPAQVFPGLTFVDSGTNYAGGWIEYSIDTSTSADSLFLETATVASTTLDSITVVGSTIFKGTGTSFTAIGNIDSVKNGRNGQNLRVSFSNTFTNGGFTDNSTTVVGDVVSLSGWTAYKRRVKLGGASTIEGWPTPTDNAFPATTDGTSGNDSAGDSNSYSVNPSYAGRSGGGYAVQLATNGNCSVGYCIIRGPYIVSNNPVYLQAGDSVSFWWSALGASDAYDVYGYLLNTGTGATIQLLNSTGANARATQAWTQVSRTITSGQDGNYKFVFIAGTWDATGGQAEGASLLLDDVNVTAAAASSITAANLRDLSLLLRYAVTNDAPELTRVARIATNNGAVDGVQTLNINPVNDPIKLQDPGSITRLRDMSDSSTATGTFVAFDPDTATVTPVTADFRITGGVDNPDSGTSTFVGNYGLLTVDTATGVYSYQFFVDTITALTVDAYETFTVTAFDGVDTATGQLKIKLLGTLPVTPGGTARTISFTSPSPLTFSKIYGETFTVTAVPSAGAGDGVITYSDGVSTACSVSGNVVTIDAGSGSCTITASISAGSTFASASTTSQIVVTVAKRMLTINGASQEMVYGQGQPDLGAYSLVGNLVGSDAISVTGARLAGIVTGVTPIGLTVVFTTGSAANYDLTVNNGSLLVNPGRLSSPSFGEPVRQLGGFTVVVNNYNPGLSNTFKVSAGTATLTGPVNGVYSVVVTGITDEVTLELMTSAEGYIFESTKTKSGPLYIQNISMDLTPIDKIVPGISKVIRPLTYVTPEGEGVYYISLTPSVCEIKLDVMIYALSTGTCTVKAVGKPSPIIQPGASATASFRIVAPPSILNPVPSATPKPTTSATPKPSATPTTSPTADARNLVVSFKFANYNIKRAEEKKLRTLLTTVGVKIRVTGYAQPSKSQPDIAISLDRALEVKKAILKLNPTAEISVIGLGSKRQPICSAYKNKCAVITFRG